MVKLVLHHICVFSSPRVRFYNDFTRETQSLFCSSAQNDYLLPYVSINKLQPLLYEVKWLDLSSNICDLYRCIGLAVMFISSDDALPEKNNQHAMIIFSQEIPLTDR